MANTKDQGARSGNFLHVNILVPERHEQHFAKLVQTFFDDGGFDAVGWQLVGAYRTSGPKALQSRVTDVHSAGHHVDKELAEDKGPFTTFVNLWQMPDGASDCDIGNVMKDLADTDSYVAVDDVVTREVQNLVWRIPMAFAIPTPAEAPKGARFLRITRRIARDELASYTMNLSFSVPVFLQAGWQYLGCHQNVTGLLNTFFELWQLPPSKNPEKLVADTLASAARDNAYYAKVEAATFRETHEILEPAGYFTGRKRRKAAPK
jgi:hypothetical protein